jgi:hypothetical protein
VREGLKSRTSRRSAARPKRKKMAAPPIRPERLTRKARK